MIIQIYAFTKPEEAAAAARMGVDQIGFVAGKYGLVPGELTFEEARAVMTALPEGTTGSALTMATDLDEILRMVSAVQPHIVHVSTDLEDVPLEAMAELRRRLPAGVQLMKAIPVYDDSSVAEAQRFAAVSDILLLDTKVSGFPGVGATGHTHDWNISRKIVETAGVPVILAGGLSAQNVREAMRVVQPWGVDSNTATNIPGDLVEKDLDGIAAFVKAVRGEKAAA